MNKDDLLDSIAYLRRKLVTLDDIINRSKTALTKMEESLPANAAEKFDKYMEEIYIEYRQLERMYLEMCDESNYNPKYR